MTYKPTTSLKFAFAHRQHVVENLAESAQTKDAANLLPILHELAEVEVRINVYTVLDRIVVDNPELADGAARANAAREYVSSLIQNGPDDGWSGRTNDLKRVRFDALLQIARDLRFVSSL